MSGPASSHKTVLIIEDRPSVASAYRAHLEAEGYACQLAATAGAAAEVLDTTPPFAALLSLELPGCDAIELITRWTAQTPETAIIAIAANASINAAVDAVRAGAWDYLVKPVSRNRLITTLNNATGLEPARSIVPAKPADRPVTMLGSSAVMADLHRQIEAIAASNAPAFITGESGTGKELCAEAIHRASPREGKPFVALNCGAIPRDLMESEIFGHLKGAFTGAISDREGAAAAADGGTLFLDEISEMDTDLQAKLLTAIEDRCLRRVGGEKAITVDVQLLVASNRELERQVRDGAFRSDLYHRLSVFQLALPALRERIEDLEDLVPAMVAEFNAIAGRRVSEIPAGVYRHMRAYRWPGNVRELRNVIRGDHAEGRHVA
jgi:two-component system repressor protein LuxO